MCPDRVISHAKRSIGVTDIYQPEGFVEKMNTVTNLQLIPLLVFIFFHLMNILIILLNYSHPTFLKIVILR